ncbi:hypothetical protein BDZ97DRAFT_1433723 [Flammula alnicola]|nr:hypothetical protein BDZ97DRAFT_1433723 [Flammula alnicola]
MTSDNQARFQHGRAQLCLALFSLLGLDPRMYCAGRDLDLSHAMRMKAPYNHQDWYDWVSKSAVIDATDIHCAQGAGFESHTNSYCHLSSLMSTIQTGHSFGA